MKPVLEVKAYWLKKALFCLAFFGLLTARNALAYGLPPLITVSPVGVTVQNGGTAQFTATVGVSLTPLTIKWQFNSNNISRANVSNFTVPIVGTTISTLTISNCSAADVGNYSVFAENDGGSVISGNGLLVVLGIPVPTPVIFLTDRSGMNNNGFQLQLLKPAHSNCVIEASTDFLHWTPIYTNNSGSTNISYTDHAALSIPSRYYRARLQ